MFEILFCPVTHGVISISYIETLSLYYTLELNKHIDDIADKIHLCFEETISYF